MKGQAIIWTALVLAILVAMLALVVDGAALMLDRRALDRGVQDAAVAGLRRGLVGDAQVDGGLAEDEARRVLVVEMGNLRWTRERPADIATAARVQTSGDSVHVAASIHICPPVWWRACISFEAEQTASLQTSTATPRQATPVPPAVVPVPMP